MPANFKDLVELIDKLRSPDGCPWDREQTYATLAPMLLEEAYEAFEAVEEARAGRQMNCVMNSAIYFSKSSFTLRSQRSVVISQSTM